MEKLRILVPGRSQLTRTQNQSKLFADMMARILSLDGYHVDNIFHPDPAQMEIDVHGRHRETGFPFFAACRFSETYVSERDLQAFFGRYMIKWHTDSQCRGLFIVLPGLDDAAKAFYRKHINSNPHITTFLYNENDALKTLSQMPGHMSPKQIAGRIPPDIGKPGEGILLYAEKGIFWAFPITSRQEKTPNTMVVFDGKGELISDRSIIEYLVKLDPEIGYLDNIPTVKTGPLQPGLFQDADPIEEVHGSSSCFEYKSPASARYFVGRKHLSNRLESFSDQVIHHRTKHRGMIFEGPAGWGKSSAVLASVEHLQKMGHVAVALDCRTASSSTFLAGVLEYAVVKLKNTDDGILETDQKRKISGFDDIVQMVLDAGQHLESRNRLFFIFFDAFESMFFLPDVLNQIKKLFQKIVEKQTNIILGFALSRSFSDKKFDAVANDCQKIILTAFSKTEIRLLLKKLSKELDETLTEGLQTFLERFSQGHPWLLKLLCFHVMVARQSGIPQADIPGILLDIEELFQQELQYLSDIERTTLNQIVKSTANRTLPSPEIFDPRAVQKLVHQGLIKRIGNSVDISWDVFREYLNNKALPLYDHYLLSTKPGPVIHGLNILYDAKGFLSVSEFKNQISLSESVFYGLVKDMDLLGLLKLGRGTVSLQFDMTDDNQKMEDLLRDHLRKWLPKNRLVLKILKSLKDDHRLRITDISKRLESLCPFIKMTKGAWLMHARVLAGWLDAADLGFLNKKEKVLVYLDPATDLRVRSLLLPKRRGSLTPRIQYAPVENMAIRLVHALRENSRVDWSGLHKNTIFKALATLEDLGFIDRKAPLIKVLPKAKAFVGNPGNRPFLFAESALQLALFSLFVKILETRQRKGGTLLELGRELQKQLGENWKESTSETVAKIMLDWARHTHLAPGVFAKIRKGPIKGWKKKKDTQLSLF